MSVYPTSNIHIPLLVMEYPISDPLLWIIFLVLCYGYTHITFMSYNHTYIPLTFKYMLVLFNMGGSNSLCLLHFLT